MISNSMIYINFITNVNMILNMILIQSLMMIIKNNKKVKICFFPKKNYHKSKKMFLSQLQEVLK